MLEYAVGGYLLVMKHRIKLILTAALLAPLFTVGVAMAVEEQATTMDTSTEAQSSQSQMTTEQKQKLEQRVKERKDTAKLRLSTTEQTRIKNRCPGAQGVVRNVEGRIKGVQTSRTQIHTNLVAALNKLEAKLSAKGADTTDLKAQIATLQTKIEKFNTDLAAYKQNVADLAAMDCATDPVAFKASLEAARAARQLVRTDSQDIRSYINDTIKPTLKSIRQTLSGETTTPGTSTEDSTTTETGGNQ